VVDELLEAYGISASISDPLTPSALFFQDLTRIFQALHAVTNNAVDSVGGGGLPIAALAPPICDAADDVM
jgi:hypothetical protein